MSNLQIIFTNRESKNMLSSKEIKGIAQTILASKKIPEHMTYSVSARTSNDFYAGKCAHVKIKMGNISPDELKSSGLLKKPSNPHNLITVKHIGNYREERTSIFLDLVVSEKDIDSLSSWIEESVDSMLARYKRVIHLIDQMNTYVMSSEYADMVKRCVYVHGSDLSDGDFDVYIEMGKEKFSSVKTVIYDDGHDTDYIFRAIKSDIDKCAKRVLMSYSPVIPEQLIARFRNQLLIELGKCELLKNSSSKRYFFNGGWVGHIPDVGVAQSNSVSSIMGLSLHNTHQYVRRVVDAGELSDYFIVGVDSYGMSLRGINAIEIMMYSQNTGFSCGRIKYRFNDDGIPMLAEVEYGFFPGSSFNYLP